MCEVACWEPSLALLVVSTGVRLFVLTQISPRQRGECWRHGLKLQFYTGNTSEETEA